VEFERASLEIDDAVAVLTMNHPEVMNAVSAQMLKGLTDALDALEASPARIRCLVLTGAGRAFSTGANLQGRANGSTPRARGAGHTLETVFHPFIRRLRDLPYPLLTAVNGAAAGAGMSLALMGDLILCARSAYFLQAFRRVGLVPDCGSTWLLPRLIGRARAIELSLLGERLPAETALAWGLVNRVFDDAALMEETRRLAHELAAGPTVALGLTRRLYWESAENSYERQLDLECRSQRIAGATEDFREGVKAFLEKRAAKFAGV
jgi:2-(1,2-epoxy-1,2-dihydrophenyl)acetyl-CoA isomerase